MAGVTPQMGCGRARQVAKWFLISLMIGVGLYCCSSVEISSSSRLSRPCAFSGRCFFFRGFGTGVINSERLRPSRGGSFSGCPSASSA